MAGVVFDTRHAFDHRRDTRQRPQVGTEPVRARAGSERAFDDR
jgi:hypothetical protein